MDYKKYEDILHEFDRAIVDNTKHRMMRFSISCSVMRVMLADAKKAVDTERARTAEAIQEIARARHDAQAYREQVVHERQTILSLRDELKQAETFRRDERKQLIGDHWEEMEELRDQLKSAERKASIWKTKCQNLRGTK